MSINVNDKNLGHATAYAYYKAGGGTMTEAEFTEFMADFGTASQTAVEAAQEALASKNAAQTAATTATNKASEATTAATTATTKAGEASTSASTATSAKDTAVSASQTATAKATEATTAAATAVSAKDDAVSANTSAQSAKTAAQTAQTGAETAAASVQSSAAQIQTNAEDISQLKSDISYIEADTDNLFTFKGGKFNGVTVERQSDGALKITGTCTASVNCKQSITPFYGSYSLVCESNVSVDDSGKFQVVLRNASGTLINNIVMSGTKQTVNATANQNNPIAMIDLTFLSGKTYNYTLYIQLLNQSYYKNFISPFTAVDREARRIIDATVNCVTPQMYGAIGDGVADDSTPIQNALNSGKDVFFPEGTYRITRTMTIPNSMYKHKIYADADNVRHTVNLKCEALPAFSNLGTGYKISGLSFIRDALPDLGSSNPENKAYLSLTGVSSDDLDIIVENCNFVKNYCMIYAKGRNMYIKNNLFYDMGNTGYCIYLDYPETADGESDTNINGFKNNFSGFRGFILEGNRCHYTRNWLLNTRNARCRKMKGLIVRDNYLEGAFCVTGYLNNAQVINNTTFQVNHYDWTDARRDACFDLIEMLNTTIDGYSCTGSDAYLNSDNVQIDEAKFSAFLRVTGDCKNNLIKNIFVSNFMYNVISLRAACISNDINVSVRKTRSTNTLFGFGNECKHNIVSVLVNDVTNAPQEGQYIIDWYPIENAEDNYFTVTANYDCVKYPE